jgi:hypothetical protein
MYCMLKQLGGSKVGGNFGLSELQKGKERIGLVLSQRDLKVYQGQQWKMCKWTDVSDKFIHTGVGIRVKQCSI